MLPLHVDDPLIPVRNLRQWLRALDEHCGLDTRAILAGTGVDPASLTDPRTRVSPRQQIAVLRRARDLGMPEDLGLIAAADFQIEDYGLLGYAMMSSATLGQAIEIALRYYKTAGPLLELGWRQYDGVGELRATDAFGIDDLLQVVLDNLFGALPELLRALTGATIPLQLIEFATPAPRNRSAYRDWFGVEARFGADVSRICIDERALALPLLGANADSALFFERSCRELLDALEGEQTLEARLRRFLLDSGGRNADEEAAARHLKVEARTLRRQLRARGTGWREIVEDVRRRIASDYLEYTELPIQQIAELLGYTEATNFRRAFVRWTGHSPHEHRRVMRTRP